MDVRSLNQLPFPGGPVVNLHPRIELLGIWPRNGAALAAAQPVAAAIARKTAHRQGAILELEVRASGGQTFESPRHTDFEL